MLAFAVILGLIIVAFAIDGVARQMREAKHLKCAELMAQGVKLD
jgi:hypothetical protein